MANADNSMNETRASNLSGDVEMDSSTQLRTEIEFWFPEEIISKEEYKFFYLLFVYMFSKNIK